MAGLARPIQQVDAAGALISKAVNPEMCYGLLYETERLPRSKVEFDTKILSSRACPCEFEKQAMVGAFREF